MGLQDLRAKSAARASRAAPSPTSPCATISSRPPSRNIRGCPRSRTGSSKQPEVLDSLMSGSGSSVFALTDSAEATGRLARALPRRVRRDALFATPFSVVTARTYSAVASDFLAKKHFHPAPTRITFKTRDGSSVARFSGRYPSGQRGKTVNLLALPSQVRILFCPFFRFFDKSGQGWTGHSQPFGFQ